MDREVQKARTETIKYHEQYYGANELFEQGSWLYQPDYELDKVAELLKGRQNPIILDIGCGVGRNAIALARQLRGDNPRIHGIDLLETAIEKLIDNATKYSVAEFISGEARDMDDLSLEEGLYDCILSISVLEHSRSYAIMINTIQKIMRATKNGGFNRLTFSTDRTVTSVKTGLPLESLVETPLRIDSIERELQSLYRDWSIEILDRIEYDENLERFGEQVNWKSSDLSFLAQKY
ncbi:MAG: methyltransferase domain-containing protein [Cryomorphaceae bacterium]|nr:methyltransferase domain-containing protein [Cryomorphaceae bacterium]